MPGYDPGRSGADHVRSASLPSTAPKPSDYRPRRPAHRGEAPVDRNEKRSQQRPRSRRQHRHLIAAPGRNEKGGKTYQSIPVVVFYDKDMKYLYHYIEFPAIYHKDRVVTEKIRAPRPGETPQQTAERAGKEFAAFQKAPFFRMWAGAGIDEMASALHERLVMGSL